MLEIFNSTQNKHARFRRNSLVTKYKSYVPWEATNKNKLFRVIFSLWRQKKYFSSYFIFIFYEKIVILSRNNLFWFVAFHGTSLLYLDTNEFLLNLACLFWVELNILEKACLPPIPFLLKCTLNTHASFFNKIIKVFQKVIGTWHAHIY